ncbi:NS1 [Gray fox amdovirus]|uniref:Initiator protein NS1 n=1 Tax=Gray fox amdovirus TaxID=1093101 RepID=G5CKI2_9VIRU|nr:NS1 [Gray fox amdovirus]AEP95278.1 NS1 [Gray fox amdovirus]
MAQAQIAEQKILQALFEQLKKEIADGEGLAWLFQQKAYTDGDNKPTKETPPLRTTSEDLRLVFDSIEENIKSNTDCLSNNEINFCKLTLGKTLVSLDKHIKSHRWNANNLQFIWQVEKGKTKHLHIHCLVGYSDSTADKKDISKSLSWFIKKINKELATIWSNHHCTLQDIKRPEDRQQNLNVWLQDGITKPYKYFNKQTRQEYNKQVNLREYTLIYLFDKNKITEKGMDGYFAAGNGGFIDNMTEKERKIMRKMYLDEQCSDMADDSQDWDDSQEPPKTEPPKVTTETISNVTYVDSAVVQPGTSTIWASCSTKATKPKTITETAKQPSKKLTTAKSTLDSLFDIGCFTPEDMILKLSDTYLELSLEANGTNKILTLLHMNQVKTASILNAFECIMKFNDDEDEKPLINIINQMGLNEKVLKNIIATVLTKQSGKRGCIWFYGPGGTGKTLLANLICTAVKNFGMVTTSNQNFPWTDCGNRNMIWLEECGNLGNFIEDFKAITGGGDIKVDTKNKQPQAIKGVTVITSNKDITKVTIGAVETNVHSEPLKQRIVKIRCVKTINPTTKITPGMLKKWLRETTGANYPVTSAEKNTGFLQPSTAESAGGANTTKSDTQRKVVDSAPLKAAKRPRHE